MPETAELARTLAEARKLRAWFVFLLAALILVTVLDLELKRQIGRQAVTAAILFGEVSSGRAAADPAVPVDHAGRVGHRDGGPGRGSSRHVADSAEWGGLVPSLGRRFSAGRQVPASIHDLYRGHGRPSPL